MKAPKSRRSISKSLRFDVFHRDGFTCQYCGSKPPDVVLELDHITPLAAGGGNDEMNLVTSCSHCNSGKCAKVLGQYKPKPDADAHFLKSEQERVEYERYLESVARRDEIECQVIDAIQRLWEKIFAPGEYGPNDRTVRGWVARFPLETIDQSIRRCAPMVSAGRLSSASDKACSASIRYASAIMYNVEEEGAA